MGIGELVSWMVLGLIAGILAKWIMPGEDPGGCFVTILIGIAGAFVGGFVFDLLFDAGGATGFNWWSLLVAVIGAIILLWIYRLVTRRG